MADYYGMNWDDPNYTDEPVEKKSTYSEKTYNNRNDGNRGFSNKSHGDRQEYRGNRYDQRDNRDNRYDQRDNRDNRYDQRDNRDNRRDNRESNRDRQEYRDNRTDGRRDGGGFDRKQFDFNEEVDIRPECLGLLIGRGGSNIQSIQTDYNVSVNIDKVRNTVKVQGNAQKDVEDAIAHIQKQIDGSQQRSGARNTYSDRNSGGRNTNFNSYREPEQKETFDSYTEQSVGNEPMIIDWTGLNEKAEAERASRWAKCPPLTKNFYQECAEVANMSAEKAAHIRKENNNTTVSRFFEKESAPANDIPNPVWKFDQCFAAYPDLLSEIEKQGFSKPSPIQAQAWPILLKGEDLIGIAQTGTGKTLAFLLPAMIHTEYQSTARGTRGGPNVLIMAPTRELALQIELEVNKYSFRDMKAVCVYGGGNRNLQISDVERGAEIIICTPGRLNDLIQAKVIDIATITYLVLDEADRMLDMGFEPQIRKILLDIRPDRQTVMTSATWPPGVRRLAQSYMSNPIQICVGSLDLAAVHTVKQIIEIMDDGDKYYRMKNFVKNMQPHDKAIIFCGRKTRADDLSSDLVLEGHSCQCIHGSRDQADREQAIADIKSGEVNLLIATDVASRGLDIEDITHVINYDFPRNIEEYVHRVGRTGRAGRTGTSISFVTRTDWGVAKELIAILEEAGQEVPEELLGMADRFKSMKERRANENREFGGGHGGRGGRGGGGRRDRY